MKAEPNEGPAIACAARKTGPVTDNTLWVAALTAGTAVLASWVTSRGNASTARIQAQAHLEAERINRQREARRTLCVDLIDLTHAMGELYWKVPEYTRLEDPDERKRGLTDLRTHMRDEYALLLRCVRTLAIEGPDDLAEAADRIKKCANSSYVALQNLVDETQGAEDRFNEQYAKYWGTVLDFIDCAKNTVRGA